MKIVLAVSNIIASRDHVEGLKNAFPVHEIVLVDPKNMVFHIIYLNF